MDFVAARWLLHYDVRLRQRTDEPARFLLLPAGSEDEARAHVPREHEADPGPSRRHRSISAHGLAHGARAESEDETTTARLPLVRPSVARARTSWTPPVSPAGAPLPRIEGTIPIFIDSAFPPAARTASITEAAAEWVGTDVDAIPVFLDSIVPPAVEFVPTPTDVDRAPVFSFTPAITDVDRAPVFSFTPPAVTDVDQAPAFSFTPPPTSEAPRTADLCVIADAEWTPVDPPGPPLAREPSAPLPRPRRLLALTPPPPPVAPRYLEPPPLPAPAPAPAPAAVGEIASSAMSAPAPAATKIVLELTPPSAPQLPAAPAASAVALPERPPARVLDELPNPWAKEIRAADSTSPSNDRDEGGEKDATSPAPSPNRRRLRPILIRTVFLVGLSVIGGVGVRNASLRARAVKPAATPSATAATSPPGPAPIAPPASTEGALDVRAPDHAPVSVDGKVRGEGSFTLKLAPGYHAVRVGNERSQLVQIHRGASASVDFTR